MTEMAYNTEGFMAYKSGRNMTEMAYKSGRDMTEMAYKSGGNMVEMSCIFLIGLLFVHIEFGFCKAVK